jgi:hypothetical protein
MVAVSFNLLSNGRAPYINTDVGRLIEVIDVV